MKSITSIIFFWLCVSIVSAAEQPKGTLQSMMIGQKIQFDYRESLCFSEGFKCSGSIERSKPGWIYRKKLKWYKRAVKLVLTEENIIALDAALQPRQYGEDTVRGAGGYIFSITWSDSSKQTLSDDVGDRRLLELLLKNYGDSAQRK